MAWSGTSAISSSIRKAGQRAFLRFGAVDYHAYVWLNGKRVGEHEGGFTPFAFEVTKLLRDGDNRLTVGADSERTTPTCRRRSPTGRIMAASPGRSASSSPPPPMSTTPGCG